MILQALKEYYDRKSADPASEIAPPGWEWKEIAYIIVLNADGEPVNVECTIEGSGKQKTTKRFLVPQSEKRAFGISAYLLWDTPEYTTGVYDESKYLKSKKTSQAIQERIALQHKAFVERVSKLGDVPDEGYLAVKRFLETPDKLQKLEALNNEHWTALKESGLFHAFRLAGTPGLVTDSPILRRAINEHRCTAETGTQITCLITGKNAVLQNLHSSIKGVWGGLPGGGTIVGFNSKAFCSYGKEQGKNAPIGEEAAFAFLTALNTLLGKNSQNRMQVGDASTIFWCSKDNHFENEFALPFTEPEKDDPDRNIKAVRSLFASIENGAYHEETDPTRFYVLGLAPNAARISIRFWTVATVEEMAIRIGQHFADLQITHGPKQPEVLSLFRLLVSTAVQGKSENIPPNLSGETMRAILNGTPYPTTLLQAVIRRIRAEHEVTYPRAAVIKAYLNRMIRTGQMDSLKNEKEINVTLDLTNMNIGYRLGRLFATLEKIQSEALPGLNATIRDRFYGAASGTPGSVFSNLMRLKNHHLSKLDNAGRRVNFERLLGEILSGVPGEFPGHLSLHDQGCFAIGYYHQMQDFFTKKENTTEVNK